MISSFDYRIPKTLEEATDLLWKTQGKSKIIGGGTDLVIGLRKGVVRPQCLIDVTNIEELRKIDEKDGILSIGAAVTHTEVASSSSVKEYGRILSDAVSEIGSPEIRNLGTIGGNIVNASPAADTIPPLIVLNAICRVVSKKQEREVPLGELFKGPYTTSIEPYEILAQVSFQKLTRDVRSVFLRLARREAMAIARMSMAIVLQMDPEKCVVEDIRICVGAVTPTPQRMFDAEVILKGEPADQNLLTKASQKISEAMVRRSGVRASTSYKVPVVESLFLRAMSKALGEEM